MIFVWQGQKVLKDWSSGLVVVEADTKEEAWKKLERDHPRAYWHLQVGKDFVFDGADEKHLLEAMVQEWRDEGSVVADGHPLQPIAYEPGQLPTLVKWGGA